MSRWRVHHASVLVAVMLLAAVACLSLASRAVAADELPPHTTCTDAVSGWHNATQTLHFASVDRGSGVRYWKAILDGGLPPWTSDYPSPVIGSVQNSWDFSAQANHSNDGLHVLEFWAIDAVGNVESHKTTQVGIDTTPPTVSMTGASVTPDPPMWTRQPIVTVVGADPGAPDCAGVLEVGIRETAVPGYDTDVWSTPSGAAPYPTSFSHSFTLPTTGLVDGKRAWICWARDGSLPLLNAAASGMTVYLNIDTVPPVTESDADSAWHNSSVSARFTASDPDSPNKTGSAGVAETECALDDGALAVGASLLVPAPGDHSGDGVHQIRYFSADNVGNSETLKTGYVKIDTTAPQTTDDVDGALHTNAVTVHFTASDPKPTVSAPVVSDCSGAIATHYSLDGGASWQTGAAVTIPVPASGVLLQAVQYYSEDAAGNEEVVKRCVVRINAAPPTTTVSGLPGGWVNHDVTLGFASAPGPGGSPVAFTEYSTDGVTWTKGATLTILAASDHSADGVHSVDYHSADAAGHIEPVQSCEVSIDTTPAAPQALAAVRVRQGKTATFKYRIDDVAGATPLSPTASVKLLIKRRQGRSWRTVKALKLGVCATNVALSHQWRCTLADGSYSFFVAAADAAGNPQVVSGGKTLTVK
jgi:hypothetical protein